MNVILAQAAGPASAFSGMFPILLIVVVFYFLLFRPQQKQQKMLREMIANLRRGDEVVMAGGLHGRVADIKDAEVFLQVSNNVTLRFDKSAVQSVKGAENKGKK